MAYTLLRGKPVKEAVEAEMMHSIAELKERGISPTVAVLRVGENAGDIYYQNSINRNAEKYGMSCVNAVFPDGTPQEDLEDALKQLNHDVNIHGIIMMKPFPKYVQEDRMRQLLAPEKDIDAITDQSYAYLFTDRKSVV